MDWLTIITPIGVIIASAAMGLLAYAAEWMGWAAVFAAFAAMAAGMLAGAIMSSRRPR